MKILEALGAGVIFGVYICLLLGFVFSMLFGAAHVVWNFFPHLSILTQKFIMLGVVVFLSGFILGFLTYLIRELEQ